VNPGTYGSLHEVKPSASATSHAARFQLQAERDVTTALKGIIATTPPSTTRPRPARRHWGYSVVQMLGVDATVTPLAAPAAAIRVADLLP
jgi:hypothetical protein